MSDNDRIVNISDPTKPNAGRIYDYVLGGRHYFDIDKKMAEQINQIAPFSPILAKMIRWFLGRAIREAVKEGYTQFLDFASGLPDVDHIHNVAPEGTKVIYSDIDPITVDLGNEIIGETSIIRYETCDAATPENLLQSKIIEDLFGGNHKAAIGFNGICYFLRDEQISHAMKMLYDWASDDSILFLTDYDGENITDVAQSIIDLYENMKQPMHIRPKKELIKLVKPWRVREPGFLSIEKWIRRETSAIDESLDLLGGGGFFSGFLCK